MVCAHRYTRRGLDYRWGQGQCFTLTNRLQFDETWEPCRGRDTYRWEIVQNILYYVGYFCPKHPCVLVILHWIFYLVPGLLLGHGPDLIRDIKWGKFQSPLSFLFFLFSFQPIKFRYRTFIVLKMFLYLCAAADLKWFLSHPSSSEPRTGGCQSNKIKRGCLEFIIDFFLGLFMNTD